MQWQLVARSVTKSPALRRSFHSTHGACLNGSKPATRNLLMVCAFLEASSMRRGA